MVRIRFAIAAAVGALSLVSLASPAATQPTGPTGDQDGDGISDVDECSGARSHRLRNGSFETPAIPANTFRIFTPDPSFFWQTSASDGKVELWNNFADGGSVPTPLAADDGAQIAELNADLPSTLFQDLRTVPGETYSGNRAPGTRRRRHDGDRDRSAGRAPASAADHGWQSGMGRALRQLYDSRRPRTDSLRLRGERPPRRTTCR